MTLSHTHELLIVTGMSGAGRSTVGNALEDLGWYVVDNLPPQMLGPISDLFSVSGTQMPKLAVIIDVRGGEFFSELAQNIELLDGKSIAVRVLYLEANDSTLVRRFEQVRRPHPLQENGTILDGISAERQRLLALRESADVVIDTSDLNIHQLTTQISEHFNLDSEVRLQLTFMSFGYKYGIPQDADHVADVRFLPNPFWDESLRPFTGLDKPVSEFVLSQNGASDFIEHYSKALAPVLSGYLRENKHYATIAIGCTGGKHRSVAVAERLRDQFLEFDGISVSIRHRDLGRE
jgi:RNase adapter protein RapZ